MFTVIAVATLALAVAANAVVFAIVKVVLINPLPYGDSDRLVTIVESDGHTLNPAAAGVYGVVVCLLAQRRQEVGLRLALGATPGSVQRMMLGEVLTVAAAGATVGAVLTLACTSLVAALLFNVSSADHETMALVAVLLIAAALTAAGGFAG